MIMIIVGRILLGITCAMTWVTLIDLILSMRRHIKQKTAVIKLEGLLSAHDAIWRRVLMYIDIICNSYATDARVNHISKDVLFRTAKAAVYRSIPKDDLLFLKKQVNGDIDYIISLIILDKLDTPSKYYGTPVIYGGLDNLWEMFNKPSDDDEDDDE